jgi:hypothetical protein
MTFEFWDFISMTLSPRDDFVFIGMSGPISPRLARMVAGCNPLRKRTPSIIPSDSNPMHMADKDMGLLLL